MQSTDQTSAALLLTSSFGKSAGTPVKPLSINEWARLTTWLKDRGLRPSSLLAGDFRNLLRDWPEKTVTLSRLEGLLDRGVALASALEKWQRAGLWILTRSDPEYPYRLKQRLAFLSPPVLFGCGNKQLLNKGGLAVVGSRNATGRDLDFTKRLGAGAAAQGYSIVSGGARGIDQSAMLGALESEGTVVGVLADSLLRSATSAKYRQHILDRNVVLISPFNPEAGFNVGNSMTRNRYVYCSADAAVVISSDLHKGGTWNGAIEDLQAQWVPLWVKHDGEEKSGNSALVQRGANRLPDDLSTLENLFVRPRIKDEQQILPGLT